MNLSKNAAVDGAEPPSPPVLVAEGGVVLQASRHSDPIVAWMELMEVVEALCPRWPERRLSPPRPEAMRL